MTGIREQVPTLYEQLSALADKIYELASYYMTVAIRTPICSTLHFVTASDDGGTLSSLYCY